MASTSRLSLIHIFTNEEREKAGLEPLEWNDNLTEAAQIRAEEITQKFSHTRPNGESPLEEWYFDGAHAEIITGAISPEDAVSRWMASDGHREAMLKERFKSVAVGCYEMCIRDRSSEEWEPVIAAAIRRIYNLPDLYLYYTFYVPTPKEAVYEKLRISSHCGGTFENPGGFYKTRLTGIQIESDNGETANMTYSQVDKFIRNQLRRGSFLSEKMCIRDRDCTVKSILYK